MLEDLVGLITKHLAVEARWICSAVCCWPLADMGQCTAHVRFWG
jgi:hypothetical protein